MPGIQSRDGKSYIQNNHTNGIHIKHIWYQNWPEETHQTYVRQNSSSDEQETHQTYVRRNSSSDEQE